MMAKRRDALAAAALADQGHGLVRVDGEADAVDDRGGVSAGPEGDGEIFDFQQRHEVGDALRYVKMSE